MAPQWRTTGLDHRLRRRSAVLRSASILASMRSCGRASRWHVGPLSAFQRRVSPSMSAPCRGYRGGLDNQTTLGPSPSLRPGRACRCLRESLWDRGLSKAISCCSLPTGLEGMVDVVVGVVPYVPAFALGLVAHDTFVFESPLAYDGGPDGTDILLRVATDCKDLLRSGGALLLELGGDQATAIEPVLGQLGFVDVMTHFDDDGDLRDRGHTWRQRRPLSA